MNGSTQLEMEARTPEGRERVLALVDGGTRARNRATAMLSETRAQLRQVSAERDGLAAIASELERQIGVLCASHDEAQAVLDQCESVLRETAGDLH